MAYDPAQELDKARQHLAEDTAIRSGKRGALQEGDSQGKAQHEIATSILTVGEELTEEDDGDVMVTRELQEEAGDAADKVILADEQPPWPQLTRAQ